METSNIVSEEEYTKKRRRGIYDKRTHTQDEQSPQDHWLSVFFLTGWFTAPTNEKFSLFFFFFELHLFN